MPTPESTTNITEQIANALRADILKGTLQSKQPLRQDEIATHFGVSKIPVREALNQLKAEGLVTLLPKRGAVVAELSAAEVDEIYAMRIALESLALRRAIPQLTVANLAQAEAILQTIEQENNAMRWGALNWEFHALLYQPANLPRLMEAVRLLHINVARYLVIFLVDLAYQTTSQQEHRAILQACRQGQVENAVHLLEQHLQSAATQLAAFLQQKER